MMMKKLSWHKATAYIIGAILLVTFLNWLGVWGIILFILIIAAWRIYTKREQLDAGMSSVETMIWGKPLKKGYWDKGELKETKVKLVWGKSTFDLNMILNLLYLAVLAIGLILFLRWAI